MAEVGKNRWVVLLNRSPKGPLTEEEVKSLLAQGVLRINDIAYQVSSDGPKGDSEWKLLWQFPEFNRRQPGTTGDREARDAEPEKLGAPSEDAVDRRHHDPEVIRQTALNELPADLMEIRAEDLLPKTTQITLDPEPHDIHLEATPAETRSPDPASEAFGGGPAGPRVRLVVGAIVGLLLVSFSTMRLLGRKSSAGDRAPTEATGSGPTQMSDNAPAGDNAAPSREDSWGSAPPGERKGAHPAPNVHHAAGAAAPAPQPGARAEEGYVPPPAETAREDERDREEHDRDKEDAEEEARAVAAEKKAAAAEEEGDKGERRDGEGGELKNLSKPDDRDRD